MEILKEIADILLKDFYPNTKHTHSDLSFSSDKLDCKLKISSSSVVFKLEMFGNNWVEIDVYKEDNILVRHRISFDENKLSEAKEWIVQVRDEELPNSIDKRKEDIKTKIESLQKELEEIA